MTIATVVGCIAFLRPALGILPANDTCDEATIISSFPFTDTEDTTGATGSLDDPAVSCATGQTWNTVWYTVTSSTDGILTFDTCGSTYDTVLNAFSGTCTSLSPLACNDNIGPNDATCDATQSRISVEVAEGQTYLIEVAQADVPTGGTLTVHATFTPRNCLSGQCLPGRGGVMSTQCISEFLLQPPITFGSRPPSTIICRDGDSCDLDGDPSNHSCTFHLDVCINNHDPNLACVPTDVITVELLKPNVNGLQNKPEDTANATALLDSIAGISTTGDVRGICMNQPVSAPCITNADCDSPGKDDGRCYRFVRFSPGEAMPDRCSLSADVVVPLKLRRNGTFKAASKRLRLRTSSSAHITDTDSLTLRCTPGA